MWWCLLFAVRSKFVRKGRKYQILLLLFLFFLFLIICDTKKCIQIRSMRSILGLCTTVESTSISCLLVHLSFSRLCHDDDDNDVV